MVEYKIWDYDKDKKFIKSFLESASKAHSLQFYSEEWFKWKFENNPNGPVLIAFAVSENVVVGGVAFSNYPFRIQNKLIKGAISFETFVHPEYQRKGIFKKLVYLAEQELIKENVELLVNFPNSNSAQGFFSSGWERLDNINLHLKLVTIKSMLALWDIKKYNFKIGDESNKLFKAENFKSLGRNNYIQSEWSNEYVDWRFNLGISKAYKIYKEEDFNIIYRLGKRGRLREAQILKIETSKLYEELSFKQFVKKLNDQYHIDIIVTYFSTNHPILNNSYFKFALPLPNKVNVFYKILDHSIKNIVEENSIVIAAGDFHTY